MKILIIGTPGSGKTTLANMIRKDLDNSITISLGSIRSLLDFMNLIKDMKQKLILKEFQHY